MGREHVRILLQGIVELDDGASHIVALETYERIVVEFGTLWIGCQGMKRRADGKADGSQGDSASATQIATLTIGSKLACIHCRPAIVGVRGKDPGNRAGMIPTAVIHPLPQG